MEDFIIPALLNLPWDFSFVAVFALNLMQSLPNWISRKIFGDGSICAA